MVFVTESGQTSDRADPMEAWGDTVRFFTRRECAWAWLAGLVAAIVALGPAFGSGSLLNLDLITSDEIPLPAGFWGIGPELPRRVPLFVPIAWLSGLIGGDLVVKLFMAGVIAAALVGASRLAVGLRFPLRIGAGALYALSPFLLTRLEVGHLQVALGTALIPWAAPVLLAPLRDLRGTFRWSSALGIAGPHGAAIGLILVISGMPRSRPRPGELARLARYLVVSQLPWLVPGCIVWAQGAAPIGSDAFQTRLGEPLDILRLLAGHGFWQPALQLGWRIWWVAPLLGAMLLGLAATDLISSPGWRRNGIWKAAAFGSAMVLFGSVPGLKEVWADFTLTAVGAPLREGHRLLPLLLLPLVLSAARVMDHLASRAKPMAQALATVGPAAISLAFVAPALWGLGGAARPIRWPTEWERSRELVESEPGTMLVLPWHLYLDVRWASNRRLLSPAPLFFGGDVIVSSDPELPGARSERTDPRELAAAGVVDSILAGEPVSSELADLGIRWVLLMHDVNWTSYMSVDRDRGLSLMELGPTLSLYEVEDWIGPAVGESGEEIAMRARIRPWFDLDGSLPATVAGPGGWGWLRGTARVGTTPVGLMAVPRGEGPLWYPPAVLVIMGYVTTVVHVLAASFSHDRKGNRPQAT